MPLPALGDARPGSYLDTMSGQDLLGQLIAMAESSAYAYTMRGHLADAAAAAPFG